MNPNIDQHDGLGPAADAPGIDFFPGSPLRPPDWRWWRAGRLLEPGARCRPRDDDWVTRARRFRAALAGVAGDPGHPRPARLDPAVHGASRLSLGPGRTRWELEARLLAGQDDGEISAKVGVDSAVVAAYEALFFDVRGHLKCTDWVALVAIGPRLHEGFGPDDLEVLWKLFAYHGGPLVLDALIAATGGGATGAVGGDSDPRLAGLIGLAVAVMTTPATPGPVDWVRLDELARGLRRRGAASCVSPVSGPIVVDPPVVGPGPAGLGRDAGDLPDIREARDLDGPTVDAAGPLREAG